MTTAEQQTIKMIDSLPFSSLEKIQRYLDSLLKKADKKAELKSFSGVEILEKLEKSESDRKAGRVYSWEEVKKISRKKYEV